MEWYEWAVLAAGWMFFGVVTLYIDYQAQTDAKHRARFAFEDLFLAFSTGPIGSVLKVASMRGNERSDVGARH